MEESDLVKKDWIEKCKATFRFHRSKLAAHESWTATKTAAVLRRSQGSVSEDLLVARWLRTHEKELSKLKGLKEAVAWIKEKEKEIELRDLD